MRALKLSVNGSVVWTAPVDGDHRLHSMITMAQSSEHTEVSVCGWLEFLNLGDRRPIQLAWTLNSGDKIILELIQADTPHTQIEASASQAWEEVEAATNVQIAETRKWLEEESGFDKEAIDRFSKGRPTGPFCAFCGKERDEVSEMVAGPGIDICDECIRLCNDFLRKKRKATEQK